MWVGEHQSVVTTNGIFRPIVLTAGRVTGAWRLPAEGIEIDLLEPVDDEEKAKLEEVARDVYRFVGRDVPPDPIKVSPPT